VATPATATSIEVDFAGEVHQLRPGQELTFGRGRSNDIVIDDNPRLHRYLGHISYRGESWWLKNTGRRVPIGLLDQASRSKVTLTSGNEISLSFVTSVVSFSAGSTSYELLITIAGGADIDLEPEDLDLTTTGLTIDHIPLVGDQRLLAIALCELALRNPHEPIELQPNKTIAHGFDWPITTLNRKLDRLCRYYDELGVTGLVGRPGQLAADRRRRLVEHLIQIGEVTTADLATLDEARSS